ncbi:hypothetical protein ON010_g3677 [Phytophthora cinnamomi]|nr:hypothetical protein ON010_g3677 [Phytophthora cinnamomi]
MSSRASDVNSENYGDVKLQYALHPHERIRECASHAADHDAQAGGAYSSPAPDAHTGRRLMWALVTDISSFQAGICRVAPRHRQAPTRRTEVTDMTTFKFTRCACRVNERPTDGYKGEPLSNPTANGVPPPLVGVWAQCGSVGSLLIPLDPLHHRVFHPDGRGVDTRPMNEERERKEIGYFAEVRGEEVSVMRCPG